MEIIRIGEHKLKLILSDEDLKKHKLTLEKLDYGNTETRRILWQILDEAKEKTGLDAAADKTLVQAYPGRKSGCEIYVTRLGARSGGIRGRHSIYCFSNPDDLFTVSRELSHAGARYESALYKDERENFYLCIKEPLVSSIQKEDPVTPLSFIEEYGKKIKDNVFFAYIREHGECLRETGAIEVLSQKNRQPKV
jgi:negative regulator of genetic competence, sporulation and motility